MSVPLDTVVLDLPDIPVLISSETIQPAGNSLKTRPEKTEESSDVMEVPQDASRVARPHAKGKGSRLLKELQSDLGPAFEIPSTEEGR